MRRFFTHQPGRPGSVITITNPDANHIRNVLRMKPGDEIWLFDGGGHEFKARINGISDEAVSVEVIDVFDCRTDSFVRITMGQALLKNKKMDTALRHLTELGMDGWVPINTERSVTKIGENKALSKTERWQTIVQESVKQCGRGLMPKIYPALDFRDALDLKTYHDINIIFSGPAGETLDHLRKRLSATVKSVFLLVGPEGGFTPREIEMAVDKGFIPAGLGPRTLKADTAAIAAGSIVQCLFGDMGKNDPSS